MEQEVNLQVLQKSIATRVDDLWRGQLMQESTLAINSPSGTYIVDGVEGFQPEVGVIIGQTGPNQRRGNFYSVRISEGNGIHGVVNYIRNSEGDIIVVKVGLRGRYASGIDAAQELSSMIHNAEEGVQTTPH